MEDASEDICEAIDNLARAIHLGLRQLGNADAVSPMGAIEAHGVAIRDAAKDIAGAIQELSGAIDRIEISGRITVQHEL